jgi:hypothetical protein
LQPCGDIDCITDHRVVAAIRRAHVGRERRAGRDADAYAEDKCALQFGVDVVHGVLNPKCRAHGAQHVIVVLDGHVEQRHNRIAQEMVDDAMVLCDDRGTRLEKFFRYRRQLLDPKLVREASIAAAVGEEYRYFGETARLPVQPSPVAKIRIGSAAPHAAKPPEPTRGAGEWNTVRQAFGRQRTNCGQGYVVE